ncbi:MAG: diphthine--ammonia ligase [Bacillota bacterium]
MKCVRFFCSWSGGKDSSLALYHAVREGGVLSALVTTLTEDGTRTRSHGLPVRLIKAQAEALGVPVITRPTSWNDYTRAFISILEALKENGIEAGVFGDIDLEAHRDWIETTCLSVGIQPCLPLWKKPRHALLHELNGLGFKALIVAVKDGTLPKSFLGRELNRETCAALGYQRVDIMGEQGEFHTVVLDGPIFSYPLSIEVKGQYFHDGYWFLDVDVLEKGGGSLP